VIFPVVDPVPLRFRRALACALACALLQSTAFSAEHYTAQDAANHIGEIGTVCGLVVSPKFAVRSKGQLTFLHLDRPYPNHIFTVVIWGKDRPKFGRPDATFAGKRICVYGLIADYEGRPEMMATDPAQITSQD
jgi:micrococcal nuclease